MIQIFKKVQAYSLLIEQILTIWSSQRPSARISYPASVRVNIYMTLLGTKVLGSRRITRTFKISKKNQGNLKVHTSVFSAESIPTQVTYGQTIFNWTKAIFHFLFRRILSGYFEYYLKQSVTNKRFLNF